MAWNEVNLENELGRARQTRLKQAEKETLQAYKRVLENIDRQDQSIEMSIKSSASDYTSVIPVERLDANRIYHVEDIRKICVNYRLRFLEAKRFKSEIPYEAIAQTKRLEKELDGNMGNFFIVAPAELFRLDEKDKDPMLLMELGNNQYFLVHKWGNDLSLMRKITAYPFRSFGHMVHSIFAMVLLISLLIPASVMVEPGQSALGIRVVFFFWLLLSTMGMVTFFAFSYGGSFSDMTWKSKYLSK